METACGGEETVAVLLPVGYHDVEPGQLATLVTCLEMFAPPVPLREPRPADWTFRRIATPDPDWYRDLFRRIGEPYLWSSRLTVSAQTLRAVLHDPRIEVYALSRAGRDEGLLELDFRRSGECELSFLGVTGELVGSGAGRALMNRAQARVWSGPLRVRRFWVHTCTLDHPAAVAFYERAGFRAFKRQVEIFDDPRATGVLSTAAAAHVPLL